MTIDFHTHAFPEKIAAEAIRTLSERSCLPPFSNGTAQELNDMTHDSGIDFSVVLNIATNEKQQQNVNNFAAALSVCGNLIPFGSVYPRSGNAFEELDRIKALGLKGIKLHPDYQDFFVDDKALYPLYERIAELGFITVFHAGYDIGVPEPIHCTPERLAAALPYFKGAPVVAAHFGGYMCWREVEEYLAGSECYFDTSFTAGRIPVPLAKRIIKKHGTERLLFGSDMPWSSADMEKKAIERLKLGDSDTEAVLGGNAKALLGNLRNQGQ